MGGMVTADRVRQRLEGLIALAKNTGVTGGWLSTEELWEDFDTRAAAYIAALSPELVAALCRVALAGDNHGRPTFEPGPFWDALDELRRVLGET